MNKIAMNTPAGWLVLEATAEHLTRIDFSVDAQGLSDTSDNPVLTQAARELSEYFAKERVEFTIPFKFAGTLFQRKVWEAVAAIPHGVTTTYAEIAERVARPLASRAVGLANKHNPLPIIVGCHRVIGTSGRLVGYGGGLPLKKWLLCHEGVPITEKVL